MHFRVGSHLDVKPVAAFLANEFHQFARVAELTRLGHARRQVAAQRNDAADTRIAVLGEHGAVVLARSADAGKMRRGWPAFALDLQNRLQRAVARRATGAEGAGEEGGIE